MLPHCKKRKNSARVIKKSRSKTQRHRDTTSADVISIHEDNRDVKAKNYENGRDLLPSWTPWIVAVCTFVIRVFYVTNPANWWVLHPDEVFQSMDVAHSEAYGYGFRPYEFISPPKGDNLSHYQLKDTMLEMNALRSPLYPQLMALIAQLFNAFGLADQPFMLWRIFHVCVTSALPLAAAMFVKASGQSSDVAALSSIFIGASSHLSVLGTHTIINSFVSPFIFLSLSWLVSLLRRISQASLTIDTPSKAASQPDDHKRNHYNVSDKTTLCDVPDLDESSSETTGISVRRRNSQTAPPGELPLDHTNSISYFPDNGPNFNGMRHMRKRSSSDSGCDNRSNCSYTSSNDGHSDEEDIDEKSRTENLDLENKYFQPASGFNLPNEIVHAPCSEFHITKNNILSRVLKCLTFDFGAGFLLGISMYSRPDSCLFVAVIVLTSINFNINFFISLIKNWSSWIFLSGTSASISLGITNDLYFFQDLSISPWQWFKFNVLSTLASELFGTSGAAFYVSNVFCGNAGIATLSLIFTSFFVFSLLAFGRIAFKSDPSEKSFYAMYEKNDFDVLNQRLSYVKGNKYTTLPVISATNTSYICCTILLVLIYTSFGHKEERFIHDVLVLYLTIIANVLIMVIQIVKSVFRKRMIVYFLMTSYCLSQWQAMPDSGDASGVNQCLYFVSKQNDARGLFLDHNFASTFSYTLVHRDIPLLINLQKDFQEFGDSSVISSNRSCSIQKDGCKVSFVSLNYVSNVIHSSNSQGIIKYLLENYQTYNYAIISSSKEFFRPAYTKVYVTDSYSVWRFTDMDSHKKHLQRITKEMVPDPSLHAIEEYEAERLKQMGNYWLALDRYRSAKKNAPNTSRILASMAFCFQRIGLMREARQAFKECLRKTNRSECLRGSEARARVSGSGKVT